MKHSPPPWLVTDTVASDRKNIFSLAANAEAHVATVIAGSRRDLARFDSNIALIKAAPEMLGALEGALELLEDHLFVQNPRAQAIARQIRSVLTKVSDSNHTT